MTGRDLSVSLYLYRVSIVAIDPDELTPELVAELVATDCPRSGSWFHGSEHCFTTFSLKPAARNTYDWNAQLGIHFTRDLPLAEEVFMFNGGWLYETRLEIRNPARFPSEFDLDQLALKLLNEHNQLDVDRLVARHEELRDSGEITARFHAWIQTGDGEQFDPHCLFRHIVLNDRDNPVNAAAALVRAHLRSQGHDGVIYGNAIDLPAVCAITFDPAQITELRRTAKRDIFRHYR